MPGWKDEINQRLKDAKEGQRFTLDDGENTFRFLPSKLGPKDPPYRYVRMHYKVGPEQRTPVRCGKNAEGVGKCWMCDVQLPKLQQSESRQKRAQAIAMAPKEGFLVQVSRVNRDNGKFGPPKPWLMDVGGKKSAYVRVLSLLRQERVDFDDPIKGRNVTMERFGTGIATTYGNSTPDEKPSKVPSAILNAMKSLDELADIYSEEKQKSAYFGSPLKEESDQEEYDAEVEETTEESAEEETVEEETEAEEEIAEEEEETAEVAEDEEYEPEPEEEEPEADLEEEEVIVSRPRTGANAPKKKVALPPAKKTAPPPAKKKVAAPVAKRR
jgi:hypothetical protein